MSTHNALVAAFFTLLSAQPVWGLDGQILITQAKALAGNVTPGDAPGFPVTLTRTGSYKLASNLDMPVSGGVNGIEANNVEITIDLNGFRIDGKGRTIAGYCIVGNQRNLTVRNGTVMRCVGGIVFKGGNIASDLRLAENSTAIFVLNTSAVIRNNTLIGNVSGISCLDETGGCLIEGNLIRGTGTTTGFGVAVGSRSTLIGNMITDHSFGVLANEASSTFPPALGDNNFAGNKISIGGRYVALHPNACGAVAC